ncbi:MAG: serine hydrolase, partial [Caldilineaceae bacterium]|nr:serine hydrolase [Caldilineaceae bacterium]
DMTHFLMAQFNGGQFGDRSLLSPAGITTLQSEGVEIGPGQGEYALGWRIGEVGGVPAVFHYGDNFNYHTLILMQPENGRGVVMLMNANSVVGFFTAFQEIEEGVARLLAGQEPAAPAPLRFGTLYLLIDLALAVPLALALWPLLRMGRWFQAQQRNMEEKRLRPWRVGLRLVWEFGLPLMLLIGTRLVLHGMGAQSWLEGFGLLTDLILWIWTLSLLMLLTAVTRFVLLRQLLRGSMTKGRN